jgi:putative ABC transport system permease protein
MTWWRRLWLRMKMEEELEKELRFHLDQHTADLIAQGLDPEEARRRSRLALGGPEQVKEQCRDTRGTRWLEDLLQDLRYGMRMLLKSPAFTLAAILSLAIGIGANTAIFSVINAVLWRPLPYPHSERLVRIDWPEDLDVATLKEAHRVFDGLAPWLWRDFTLTGRGPALRFWAQGVTPEFFSLLGFTPQAGRAFAAEEFQPGHDQVVIISDRLWRTRFGADPQIIGQALTLSERSYMAVGSDRSYTVVGVAPPLFDFWSDNLFIPQVITANDLRDWCCLESVARLKKGRTLEQALRELAVFTGGSQRKRAVRIQPLRESVVKDFRLTLLAFWGVAGFVLLIACASLANLMLARAANRQKELAVRAAIGARRLRLMRQLLTESVLVALLGGVLSVLLAYLGVKALSAANPVIYRLNLDPIPIYDPGAGISYGTSIFTDSITGISGIPRLGEVKIDGTVMFFTFILALLTGTLFGLAPALQFSRPDLNHALKDGAAISGTGFGFRRRRRTQNLLVIGEVALALVLLAGAGLLIRSIWRLHEERLGFQPEKVLTIQLQFPFYGNRDGEQVISFFTQLSERLSALPGVKSVGATNTLPLLRRGGITSDLGFEGKPHYVDSATEEKKMRPPKFFFSDISPNYIRTMGIPLLQGREFDSHDNLQSSPVVIINESMARRQWPGENPVGKRFKLDFEKENSWVTVVGVVGDAKRFALEYEAIPEFYLPLLQKLNKLDIGSYYNFYQLSVGTFVVMRVAGRPKDMAEAVRQTVWSLDRDLPIPRIASMEDRVADVFAPRRFNMLLFGVFAIVALLLAVIGIYGVIAYSVAQRTHEIGIRMALGATSRDVLWLVVRQGLLLALIGVAVGTGAALALTRILKNLLFGVSATDPATFALIALLLVGVALIASYIPARRAAKIDPLLAIRHE